MRFFSVFSASLLLALSGCGPSGEGADDTELTSIDQGESSVLEGAARDDEGEGRARQEAAPAGQAAPGEASAGPIPAGLIGSWISPSCGERTYARVIRFEDSGDFTGKDLVSPCPPDVTCVWSGIVHKRGTYAVSGSEIILDVTGPSSGPQFAPFPTSLRMIAATSAPVETTPDGDVCVYARETETNPQPR